MFSLLELCSSVCYHGTCDVECHCHYDTDCIDYDGEYTGEHDVCRRGCRSGWEGIGCQVGNVAEGKEASQTDWIDRSFNGDNSAGNCVDGSSSRWESSNSCCGVALYSQWEVSLRGIYVVNQLKVHRSDNDRNSVRNTNIRLYRYDQLVQQLHTGTRTPPPTRTLNLDSKVLINRIQVQKNSSQRWHLRICEVEAFGYQYKACVRYNSMYYYRPGCLQNCYCQEQCDYITGGCPGTCMAGYQHDSDDVCVPCDKGTWGVGCLQNCYCQEQCDYITGECLGTCMAGYQHDSDDVCLSCDEGTWGVGCLQNCYCQEQCDYITGECLGTCMAGYQNDSDDVCLPCDEGTWGVGCLQNCYCQEQCDYITGECPGTCMAGYQHNSDDVCVPCDEGTWGAGCLQNCYCQEQCDYITGECSGTCMAGYQHTSDDVCVPCDEGTWGAGCSEQCHCRDQDVCDHVNGTCPNGCPDVYTGTTCQQLSLRESGLTISSRGKVLTVAFSYNVEKFGFIMLHASPSYSIIETTLLPSNGTQFTYELPQFKRHYIICIIPVLDGTRGESSPCQNVFTECEDGYFGNQCQHRCTCPLSCPLIPSGRNL